MKRQPIMASSSSKQAVLLAVVVAAVACLAPLASATQWVVGDECGWKHNFNQTGWENGKTFVVGDTLQFVYPKDKHTVVQLASEEDFAACNKHGTQLGAWCSGNDVVQLDRPGKMWFICTKGAHCRKHGVKLAIDVVGAPFQGSAPPPPPPTPVYGWPYPGAAVPPPPPPPPTAFGWPYSAPAWPLPPPPPPSSSAAVRNLAGSGAVAVAAAAVVVAALAF